MFVYFFDMFYKYFVFKNFYFIIECDLLEELECVYKRLIDDGGYVKVKFNKIFFNVYYVEVKDCFNGIIWVFNYFLDEYI